MTRILTILAILCVTACNYFDPHIVEGVVEDVQFIEGSLFGSSAKTIIHFKDGRIMQFDGISGLVLHKNKLNILEVARDGVILNVTIRP